MFFITLILLTASIMDDCQLVSKTAQFDGTNLLFSDSVEIENDLGTVVATKASFEDKERSILLEQGVKFIFKKGGELQSDTAKINLTAKTISLFSKDKIIFKESLNGENISIKSSRAECAFNSSLKKSSTNDINSITFDGGVEMNYKNNLLEGERAEYKKGFAEPEVILSSKERCFFKHNKDEIFALSAKFYPNSEDLFLEEPIGKIHFNAYLFDVAAKEGIYKKRNNEFILQKEVSVKDEFWGSLKTDKVILSKEEKKMVAEGKTFLNLESRKGKLTFIGTATLDDEKRELSITASNEPLLFQDDKMVILADRAHIFYNTTREPSKLTLKGNIRFVSKQINGKNSYGIADEVEYNLLTQEILFTGLEDKKVVFWQENDALAISANRVIVKKDPLTKKEEVKGIGDVRFSLDFEEEKIIKDLFSKYLDKL